MSRSLFPHAIISLALLMLIVGCGKKNPVDEISVSDSGIQIVQRERNEDPLAWPRWRGPSGNGHVEDQPLLRTWDENTNVVWRTDVPGRGHGSPIVVGDRVFLATALEDQQIQQVIALDRGSGQELWTTVVHKGSFPPKKVIHHKGTYANGTVACDGSRLFIAFFNGDSIFASALSLDGDIVWQKEIGKFVSRFGYAPSPLLYKSLVIFAADNGGGGYLAALDGETGQIAWRVARGNVHTYSSPAIANVGGRDQLLISGGDNVASYDPATGEQNWKARGTSESTCGTVVTSDTLIFASGGYPDQQTICLDADGNRVWDNSTKVYEPSMLVAGERLFAVTDDGIGYCWQAATGDVIWKKRLGGGFSASPILCNGVVYVSNLNGETFVFSTDGDEYQQIAKNKLGDDTYASPAVAEGHLFLRIGVGSGPVRREQLVCLSDVKPAETSEPAEQSSN